jgi:hypothetical protein
MIREAKGEEDMKQICVLLEILRLQTPYRAVVPSWEMILDTLLKLIMRKDGLALVAEHDGKMTGVLLATAQPLWWVHPMAGARIASDLVFYSQRYGDGRRMLRQMVDWAFGTHRVIRIEMGVSSGQAPLDVMRRLYASEGFALEGSFFVRNHPNYQAMLDPVPQGEQAA